MSEDWGPIRGQRTIFDTEDVPSNVDWPPSWADDDLGVRWWAFHLEHPEVYNTLRDLTWQLVERGYRHLGIKMLWETLRYQTMLGAQVPGEDVVRLNNNHTSLYARLIMEREPGLEGIFETRDRISTRG